MEIEKLSERPESKTLEFKSDLSSLDPILKTIVAFANTAGGILIVGLSQQGKLLGIENIFKAEEKLANAIADNIYPSILPEIEISTLEGKNILVVRIAHWKGPFYLKKFGMPNSFYVRLGSTSRPAGPELIAEMQRTILHPSYDEQPLSELSLDSLEFEKAQKIFRQAGKELNEKKLRSLGILVPAYYNCFRSEYTENDPNSRRITAKASCNFKRSRSWRKPFISTNFGKTPF